MDNERKHNKKELIVRLTVVGLVLLCINPSFTQGHANMNVLLNAGMVLSPLVLIFPGARIFIPRIDIPAFILIGCVILFPLMFHPETLRLSTMLFTCSYCVMIMMMGRLLRLGGMDENRYLRLIRVMTFIFAGVLILQQICQLAGLPVPLKAINYPNPWKLNSLTAEPSHTTVILSIIFFFYARIIRKKTPKQSLWASIQREPALWLAYAWSIFSTDNASAFVVGPLCVLPFITKRNIGLVAVIIAVVISVVVWSPLGKIENISRVKSTATAISTLNDSIIIKADESASARLVPTIRGSRLLLPINISTITGHGVDADQTATAPRPCDELQRGSAGIFSLWYNYGALAAIAFWILIGVVTLIAGDWLSVVPFIMAVQLGADFNMQLCWMVMMFSMVYKYSVAGRRQLLSTRL